MKEEASKKNVLTVQEISEALGIRLNVASQNLSVLASADLIVRIQRGRYALYVANADKIAETAAGVRSLA